MRKSQKFYHLLPITYHQKMYLELKNIEAAYGANSILRDFSLSVESGEIVALLGESGCGKTTALKIVAGLLEKDSGEVWLGGENISRVPAERREMSLVFQKPLLFPFLNVAENISFGLKMRNFPKAEIARKVAEALKMVRLENYETRLPRQLSGGQEQRVSLARAIVTNPRVLLLDEPFSALDARLRVEMRNLVGELQRRLKITTVFVTHDQEEAVSIADRIAFLDNGNLAQIGEPHTFFTTPKTVETARFFGWKTIAGRVAANDVIETSIGKFELPNIEEKLKINQTVQLAFHPNRVKLSVKKSDSTTVNTIILGELERAIDLGAKLLYTIRTADSELLEIETSGKILADDGDTGKTVKIYIPENAVRIFF